ncbi:MAG: hypothetical protein WCI22_15335, partial [Actinomycetota bacterium]
LAGIVGPTPAPITPPPPQPPAPGRVVHTVDDIDLPGLDDRVNDVAAQMRAAMQANPDKKLFVTWWLE